jgi:hypothetical protein
MRFALLVAIVEQSLEDRAIDVAKANGAGGVTSLTGKGIGLNEKKTFFGLTYERPESVLLFVLEKRTSVKVMKALRNELKLETEHKGLVMSLPIEHLAGIPANQIEAFANRLKEEKEV